ncbi:MAG: glycosyltransferase family 1 protein [Bacteroidota bacterium]
MVRVLIDYGNATASTGIGTYARCLLKGLQQYHADEVLAEEAGVSLPAKSLRPIRRLIYMGRMSMLRKTGYRGFQVVHFANNYVPRPITGVRYVSTMYDLDTLMEPKSHSRRFVLYYKAVNNKMIERSERIITISDTVRKEIIDYFHLDESRVRMGGIGISPEFERLAASTGKTTSEEPTLLYVGQLNRKKNVAWLVRTIAKGVSSGAIPRVKLMLAGNKGYGFNEIGPLLKTHGRIVQWQPGLGMEDLVKLYCRCSAVVLPSLREGFGLTLLEAMCCGKPIVASRIPSSLEVADGVADFFSLNEENEFYEAVKSALAGKSAAERRLIAAQRLDKYSWKHVSGAHRDIYQEVFDLRP